MVDPAQVILNGLAQGIDHQAGAVKMIPGQPSQLISHVIRFQGKKFIQAAGKAQLGQAQAAWACIARS